MNFQPYDQGFQPIVEEENKENELFIDQEITLVYIYGLPPWIKWRDVKNILMDFLQENVILHIQINPTGSNINNGIISVNSLQDAIKIFENLNNYDWNGFIISIRIGQNEQLNNYPQFLSPIPIPQPLAQGYPPPPPQAGFPPGAYYNFIPVYNPYQPQPQPQQPQFHSPPPQITSPFPRPPSQNYTTSLQSPRIQPSRQLTLRQLNYQDITEINDDRSSSSPGSSNMSVDKTRLFIGNLPFDSDWKSLKDFLRRAGDIIRVEIPRDNNKLGGYSSKGFGIAIFSNETDAKRAIEFFNGVVFQGRPLTVRYDKFPRVKQPIVAPSTTTTTTTTTATTVSPEEKIEIGKDIGEDSFDDGEFAKEARNLVESLGVDK